MKQRQPEKHRENHVERALAFEHFEPRVVDDAENHIVQDQHRQRIDQRPKRAQPAAAMTQFDVSLRELADQFTSGPQSRQHPQRVDNQSRH